MNSDRVSQWRGRLCGCAVAAALTLFAAGAIAQEPGLEQMRDQIRNLERKAQELKAAGKSEDAEAVAREARELRGKMVGMERDGRADSAREKRRVEIQRKLAEARARLKELDEAGKEDQAAEVRRHMEELKQELVRLRQQGEREAGSGPDQGPAAAERRIRHVREAIVHLRAAGMQDAAGRLTREVERMEQQLRASAPEPRGPVPATAEIARLRAELQELRQAVRRLQARLDDQGRDRPAAQEQ